MKRCLASVFCLLWVMLPHAQACVGCRQPGAAIDPDLVTAGVAFSFSVVSLLVLVVVVLAGLTAYIAKTCQRLDREKNPQ